jgi:predicted ferric reductase
MPSSIIERTQTVAKMLIGKRSDWRLTKPTVPHVPQFNSTWIGPVMAVITICIGWFAFPDTIGDGNAAFALYIGSVSIMMMTWSNLLSTRVLPLEQIFGGVDRMYIWHRWLGALSVGAMWLHMETTDDIKGIRGASRDVADAAEDLAETGSTLLYILVGISLLRWIPTRWWRFTHKLLILPYAFACWHFYTATKPYANDSFWGNWFTGFMFLGIAAYLYRVVWRDMLHKGKIHRVSNIEHSGNVITFELEPLGTPLK